MTEELATPEAVLDAFRRRLDGVEEALGPSGGPFYRDGYTRGWRAAVKVAEAIPRERSALEGLNDLHHELREECNRAAEARPNTPAAAQPELRTGKVDALQTAIGIAALATIAAEDIAEREERAAERRLYAAEDIAEREEQAAERAAQATREVSVWDSYPKLPLDGDYILNDLHGLALFLGGDGNSFTGDLLRLIGKSDPTNLHQLSLGFPRHVEAFFMWRACAPVPVRTMLALLKATNTLTRMNGDRQP